MLPDSLPICPEILFNSFEWGRDHNSISEFIGDEHETIAYNAYMAYPDAPFDYSPLAENAGNILFTSSLDVLGHDAISSLFFSYCLTDSGVVDMSSDSFYLVRSQITADDCESVYAEIVESLSALYGTGKEAARTGQSLGIDENEAYTYNRDIYETLWAGANNTFARIKLEVPGVDTDSPTLFIAFGKLDAAETLERIELQLSGV